MKNTWFLPMEVLLHTHVDAEVVNDNSDDPSTREKMRIVHNEAVRLSGSGHYKKAI